MNFKRKYKTLKCPGCKNKLHLKKTTLKKIELVSCWACGNRFPVKQEA